METKQLLNQVKDAFTALQAAKDAALAHNMLIAETDAEKQASREYRKAADTAEEKYNEIYEQFSAALNEMPDSDERRQIAKQAMKYVSY